MKILVLGSNGQLGSDLKTLALDYPEITLIPWTRSHCDVENLGSISEALSKIDFEVLINCTSYHKVDEVEFRAEKAMTINAHAVKILAEICQAKGARFLHITTDYVFGGQSKRSPLTEEDRTAPVNVYGASKLLGESLAQVHCKETIIFRVASLFGIHGSNGKGSNFTNTILRLAKERPEVKVVNDQIMSPTSTHDLAQMIFKFLELEGAPGIYHAVNTGEVSWYTFAKAALEFAGISTPISGIPSSEYPLPALRPKYSALSNEKLTKVIGEIPHWKESLKHYIRALSGRPA